VLAVCDATSGRIVYTQIDHLVVLIAPLFCVLIFLCLNYYIVCRTVISCDIGQVWTMIKSRFTFHMLAFHLSMYLLNNDDVIALDL